MKPIQHTLDIRFFQHRRERYATAANFLCHRTAAPLVQRASHVAVRRRERGFPGAQPDLVFSEVFYRFVPVSHLKRVPHQWKVSPRATESFCKRSHARAAAVTDRRKLFYLAQQ